MRGYKVFDKDFQCRGYQFAENSTFEHDGELVLCDSGFHFCTKASDCFNYYDFDSENIVCEVEAIGDILESDEDSKCVTNKLSIGRRIGWHEVLEIANTGSGNTGIANSGNWNSGNRNSGVGNSGNRNSGVGNSGDWNSGNRNSGDWNSGDFNSCSHSAGFFNSKQQTVSAFNRDTGLTYNEYIRNVPFVDLTLSEFVKSDHPKHAKEGGYYIKIEYKDAWKNWWNSASKKDKEKIKSLPNFDAAVFFEITGIEV